MPERRITTPEALAAAAVTMLAVTIVVGYVWGRLGAISPPTMLAVSVLVGLGAARYPVRYSLSTSDTSAFIAAALVFGGVAAWLAYLAWPALLPPGRGPDLTHHLMLVDYVERNWRLPDASLVPVMVEMAHYTPGVHLLAALAGDWTRTSGFQAIYLVIVFTVALKSVFVFLIAARMLPADRARIPLALAAVVLCTLPAQYFLGSFAHDSFLAQVAAEFFAVAMWWAVAVWDERPASLASAFFAIAGVGAVLTWPVWVGPPIVTFAAIALTREAVGIGDRVRSLVLTLTPIALVAGLHTGGRLQWLAMAGTNGIVLQPSIDVVGWPFFIAAAAGIALAPFRRENRVALLLALSIAAQGVTLHLLAQAHGASTPYMAFKMMYLLIYPLAVLGAVVVSCAFERRIQWVRRSAPVGWAVLFSAIAAAGISLAHFSEPTPIVSHDLHAAGKWARGHVEATCVDYLVPNHETMHWLHLAVLGNARSTLRTADPSTFDPDKAIVRWIEPAGLPYAIAQMSTLPNDVLNNVDVLEQFGSAAVISRRGPSICADAQRLAGAASQTRSRQGLFAAARAPQRAPPRPRSSKRVRGAAPRSTT